MNSLSKSDLPGAEKLAGFPFSFSPRFAVGCPESLPHVPAGGRRSEGLVGTRGGTGLCLSAERLRGPCPVGSGPSDRRNTTGTRERCRGGAAAHRPARLAETELRLPLALVGVSEEQASLATGSAMHLTAGGLGAVGSSQQLVTHTGCEETGKK